MIAIVDYGVGNLFSIKSSLDFLGLNNTVTGDADTLRKADRIILPGVGAFADAAKSLEDCGLAQVVCDEARGGKPLMGICLGMQLLFDRSFEYGEHKGLGLIKGDVVPISDAVDDSYKIPHIGWNPLHFQGGKDRIFRYMNEGDCVYFVHSYYAANCDDSVIAAVDYGVPLTAAVAHGNIYGCQFHPEKSGAVGLNILRAFGEI